MATDLLRELSEQFGGTSVQERANLVLTSTRPQSELVKDFDLAILTFGMRPVESVNYWGKHLGENSPLIGPGDEMPNSLRLATLMGFFVEPAILRDVRGNGCFLGVELTYRYGDGKVMLAIGEDNQTRLQVGKSIKEALKLDNFALTEELKKEMKFRQAGGLNGSAKVDVHR